MPMQKFSADDEKKKKIKQLEKEIKLMKKDMQKTFAEEEKLEKKKMTPIYIGIAVLILCVIILAAVYFYLNTVL